MAKRVVKGRAFNVAPGIVYFKGKNPNKIDDIDIGPNNSKGLSVNNGEFGKGLIASANGKKVTPINNNIKILSNEPMFNGKSPAQLFYRGMPFDTLFTMQEQYKDIYGINDDGTRQAKYGKNILRKVKNKLNNLINNSNSLLNRSNTLSPIKESEEEKNQGIDWSGIKTTNNRSYDSNYIDYINKGLVSRGIGKNQRAAIIANIIEESGGNPFAVDSTKKFKGLLQWEESRYWPGDEKDVYKEIDNQLDYIVNTAGNATDRKSWTHGGKGSGYNSLTDAMAAYNSEDDLEAAMKGYTLGYVRPAGGINSYNNRLKVAQQLNALKGFAFGGQITKQSLGERPNAKFGKEMSKKKVLKYPKQEIVYPGGSIRADKLEGKQMPAGTRIRQTVNGLSGNVTPGYNQARRSYTRDIKYGETPAQNDTLYTAGNLIGVGPVDPKIGFNNGYYDEGKKLKYGGRRKKAVYGRNVDPFMGYGRKLPDMPFTLTRGTNGYLTPQFKPIEVPKLDIGVKSTIPQVDPFMGIKPAAINKSSTVTNSGENGGGISAKGMDGIGAGIQTLGNLAAAGIQQIAINNMEVTPHQYTLLNPVKLKTKVNVAPQVAAMRDTVAKLTDAARRTSASSRTMYQKTSDARRYGDQQISGLLGEKENKETALINQDRLNQQTIAEKNANRVMDTINGNTDRESQLKMEKNRLTANNWIGAINNQVAILDGPQGVFAREEARRSQAANLAMMSMAYPDAARLMQGDRWTHAFDGYYDMLNSRGGRGNG